MLMASPPSGTPSSSAQTLISSLFQIARHTATHTRGERRWATGRDIAAMALPELCSSSPLSRPVSRCWGIRPWPSPHS